MNLWTKRQLIMSAIARGATILWTSAQWLLNAALTANPIGIVIVAVGALIAGIILLWGHIKRWTQAMKDNREKTMQVVGVIALLMGPLGWMIAAGAAVALYWDEISGAILRVYNAVAKFLGLPLANLSKDIKKNVGEVKKMQKELDDHKPKKNDKALKSAVADIPFTATVVPPDMSKIMQQANIPAQYSMPQKDVAAFASKYEQPKYQAAKEITKTVNLYFKNLAQTINITGDKQRESTETGSFLLKVLNQYVEAAG